MTARQFLKNGVVARERTLGDISFFRGHSTPAKVYNHDEIGSVVQLMRLSAIYEIHRNIHIVF